MSRHTIEVRNLRFSFGAHIPKHWLGGKRSVSTFFDNLSTLFPQGERFFMDSVRDHEAQIVDPQLKDEVRRFYSQEALHSREHVRYNDMLRESGYPIDEMENDLRRLLAIVSKLPPRMRLAVTCSLEHFTALLAQYLLTDDRVIEGAHPVMAALWRWHAAEENEHASVAYDVYGKVGGFYAERVVVMAVASVIFALKVTEQQMRMMRSDGTLFSVKEWRQLGKFLFSEPGWLVMLTKPYLAYYRPSFHPDDLNVSHLLERWREDFKTLAVYRESERTPRKVAA